ncbi:MAG: c-type cytochrome [Nitrospiraceae bacterium]|nr:c-type cytochrome [Nitrospiraceae bacterium]
MKFPSERMAGSGWVLIAGAIVVSIVIFLAVRPSPDGEHLFRTVGCMNCHSFRGEGGEMAPDLTGVTGRRSDGWIREQIENSKRHNPDSRMPSFSFLSGRQISAIIRYLHSGGQS